jgi:hypothetical protein
MDGVGDECFVFTIDFYISEGVDEKAAEKEENKHDDGFENVNADEIIDR